jgi:hypothetical protein
MTTNILFGFVRPTDISVLLQICHAAEGRKLLSAPHRKTFYTKFLYLNQLCEPASHYA